MHLYELGKEFEALSSLKDNPPSIFDIIESNQDKAVASLNSLSLIFLRALLKFSSIVPVKKLGLALTIDTCDR